MYLICSFVCCIVTKCNPFYFLVIKCLGQSEILRGNTCGSDMAKNVLLGLVRHMIILMPVIFWVKIIFRRFTAACRLARYFALACVCYYVLGMNRVLEPEIPDSFFTTWTQTRHFKINYPTRSFQNSLPESRTIKSQKPLPDILVIFNSFAAA